MSRHKPNIRADLDRRAADLRHHINQHIVAYLGNDFDPPRIDTFYKGLAYSVRERLIKDWLQVQRSSYDERAKRVYYLSLEFLPGRFLMNYILNLGLKEECQHLMKAQEIDFTLEELEEEEWDAGLGNGGLGRLASCFMDSMATLRLPGYGYGIHYDYGIFFQTIVDGYQVEKGDNWHRSGSPWEIYRPGFMYEVKFNGRSEVFHDDKGRLCYRWVDTRNVMAMAIDILIPGFENKHANNMRLWAAASSREFDLTDFNMGDYVGAVEEKITSENISKVLYPSDERQEGRELRLKQQYFFVAATFQDIMRRFKKRQAHFSTFPDAVAIQLNDTHPAISIPELMRLLMDKEGLGWEQAWDICYHTFAYTNHTTLPEALESWPVSQLEWLLPRHMDIIREIDRRFLAQLPRRFADDPHLRARLAIISNEPEPRVRMAHLAIVGSHKVNGVAGLHTEILKKSLFKEFHALYPGKFVNITNGITPRRWLLQSNPPLAGLISAASGENWLRDLNHLKKLAPLAEDAAFRQRWREVKRINKERLARYILRKTGQSVSVQSLFDVQVKRIHEYKRQLLNVLHVIALYQRIKRGPQVEMLPRTVIFGGKAAPGYFMAKLIIKLINSVAETVNNDPEVRGRLTVVFLPNYCVSQAEKLVPAADLSEQISTAGMEASGTGNMKFALSGALTIGTLDGANVEIRQEVGAENIFIFGLTADQVARRRQGGHDPHQFYHNDPILKETLDAIAGGLFAPEAPGLFQPIIDGLLNRGDHYMVLADFKDYLRAQLEVAQLYRDPEQWTRRSILNTAHMGKFSSDRAIAEYAQKIWQTKPLENGS